MYSIVPNVHDVCIKMNIKGQTRDYDFWRMVWRQAVDRCHRLGQMREVLVSKLIMTRRGPDKETVEQRIMAMQARAPSPFLTCYQHGLSRLCSLKASPARFLSVRSTLHD